MNITLGITIAVIAGAVNGLFALPMKAARSWAWENNWLPFNVLSLVIFPWIISLFFIPNLLHVYELVPEHYLIIPVLWGMAVYTGSLLFGISLSYIGTALAFALLVGSMTLVGVLIPILMYNPETVATFGGKYIIAGAILLLASLAISMYAGKQKEKAQGGKNTSGIGDRRKKSAALGMALALSGGILSGLLSLGMNMDWAKTIIRTAAESGGAAPANATNAILTLILLGGAIPNVVYCGYLLHKNNTWRNYFSAETRHYWLLMLLIGVMYSGSVVLWGISISEDMLGQLGPSVGWALFIGMVVVSSNIGGFLTGEWKKAGARATGIMLAGLALMILAMVLIAYGNYCIGGR